MIGLFLVSCLLRSMYAGKKQGQNQKWATSHGSAEELNKLNQTQQIHSSSVFRHELLFETATAVVWLGFFVDSMMHGEFWPTVYSNIASKWNEVK